MLKWVGCRLRQQQQAKCTEQSKPKAGAAEPPVAGGRGPGKEQSSPLHVPAEWAGCPVSPFGGHPPYLPLMPIQQGRPVITQSMCKWLVWFPALLLVQIWKKMGRPCSWSSKEVPPEAPPRPPTPSPHAGRHGAAGQSQSLLPDPPETYRPFGDVIRPLMRVHGCWLLTHPVEGGVLGNFMCGTQQQPLCPGKSRSPTHVVLLPNLPGVLVTHRAKLPPAPCQQRSARVTWPLHPHGQSGL